MKNFTLNNFNENTKNNNFEKFEKKELKNKYNQINFKIIDDYFKNNNNNSFTNNNYYNNNLLNKLEKISYNFDDDYLENSNFEKLLGSELIDYKNKEKYLDKKLEHITYIKNLEVCKNCLKENKNILSFNSMQYLKEAYSKNIIVFRAVNLISRNLASLPIIVTENNDYENLGIEISEGKNWKYNKKSNNSNDNNYYEKNYLTENCENNNQNKKDELQKLINEPNKIQNKNSFFETLISQFLLFGNAFVILELNNSGFPKEMKVVSPENMKIFVNDLGDIAGYEMIGKSENKIFPICNGTKKSLVLHIKTFNPENDKIGLSPIIAAEQAIKQHNSVSDHNFSILRNGGRPSGAILIKPNELGGRVSSTQLESIKNELRETYSGTTNAGKIMIIDGNCEWKEMGFSPKDLDFSSGKSIAATEIAEAFGVPPILVGLMDAATYSNYKEARLHLWEDTLLPLMDQILDSVSVWLLNFYDENFKIEYDKSSVPALRKKNEGEWDRIANATFLTINEKRTSLGFSKIIGGDNLKFN